LSFFRRGRDLRCWSDRRAWRFGGHKIDRIGRRPKGIYSHALRSMALRQQSSSPFVAGTTRPSGVGWPGCWWVLGGRLSQGVFGRQTSRFVLFELGGVSVFYLSEMATARGKGLLLSAGQIRASPAGWPGSVRRAASATRIANVIGAPQTASCWGLARIPRLHRLRPSCRFLYMDPPRVEG